jgi:hypothetical protein
MAPIEEKGSPILDGRSPDKSAFANLGFGRDKSAPLSLICSVEHHVNAAVLQHFSSVDRKHSDAFQLVAFNGVAERLQRA